MQVSSAGQSQIAARPGRSGRTDQLTRTSGRRSRSRQSSLTKHRGAGVLALQVSIVDLHLQQSHHFHLTCQLVNLFLQLFVLLIQVGQLLGRHSESIAGKAGVDASCSITCVPIVTFHKSKRQSSSATVKSCFNPLTFSFEQSIKFGSKYHQNRGGSRKLSANETEKVFHIRSGIRQYCKADEAKERRKMV
jgi:hypothetical protein